MVVDGCTPILGNASIQEMDLVRVQYYNIISVNVDQGENRSETKQSRPKTINQEGRTGNLSQPKQPRSSYLLKDELVMKYPDVFQGTGKLKGQCTLEVKENVEPVVHSPRRVPIAILEKLKQELQRLEDLEIITKVVEPTSWVSSLVIVHKSNGQIRVCIDPKDLNQVLRRSY